LPNFFKVNHLIVIPSYKESYEKIKETLESIREQTFPKEQIHVYMAFEAREEVKNQHMDEVLKAKRGDFTGVENEEYMVRLLITT
jgi:cellulose synthase/poly-beta-1,6-N-acetylglucosamine synthase-like glycosyltransferase